MLPFGIGLGEVLLILAVILLVVGPQKLPEMAKTLGKGLRTVRKAGRELREAVDLDDVKQQVFQPIRQWEQQQRIEEAELLAEDAKQTSAPETNNAEPLIDEVVAEKTISKPVAVIKPDGVDAAQPDADLLNDGADVLDEDAEQIIAREPSTLYKKPRLLTPTLTDKSDVEDDGPDQPT
ncbi:MAG: Tat protein translocase TatB subunit [Bradymonadia bacterium]|jgi:Tat protein translocase TatB subunit